MELAVPLLLVLAYLLIINLIGFVLMFADKKRAQNNEWRIREASLFLTAILGGSVGSMLGMKLFRHKTKHKSFRLGMPAILIAQAVLVIGYYFYLH